MPSHAQELLDLIEQFGSQRKVAKALGIPESTLRYRLARFAEGPGTDPTPETNDNAFSIPVLPFEDEPIEEFLARRAKAFKRKATAEEARKLIPIQVNLEGPFGILHMGDPHLDDDGCDIALVQHHINLAKKTPGLLVGNAGDLRNNWIGRLARLYDHQGTTAADGRRLVEWFMREVRWLYIIGGNHDAWSGADDPISWLGRQLGITTQTHGLRLELIPPKGRRIRINGRHDWAGHSQWNPAHGPMKAAMMGPVDHIYISGHRHIFGQGVVKDAVTGIWQHAIRIGTYKVFDEYAKSHGFPEHNLPAVVTVINPCAEREEGVVEVIKDVDTAADYISFLRKRF